jgi:sugar phosphate isomerase/epimerase
MWRQIKKRLSLCHGTLITIPPPEFAAAAAAAGFKQVSMRVLTAKGSTPGPVMGDFPLITDAALQKETRKRLDDLGVSLVESEVAVFTPGKGASEFDAYLAASVALGATGVIPVFFGHESEQEVIDQFSDFCERAAQHRLTAFVEFIVQSAIKSIPQAADIIQKSGVQNAKIIVDSLHWTRSGSNLGDITGCDPSLFHGAQINDGDSALPNEGENWWVEMSKNRSFLGDGDFQVREMLAAMPNDAPVGIEIISEEFHKRSQTPEEMAKYVMENARSYFGADDPN